MFDDEFTWDQAQAACQSQDANLVTIVDSQHSDFIVSLFPSGSVGFWIGAHKPTSTSDWVWADKTPFTFTNWSPPNPSGDGDCADMYALNGVWNDKPCWAAQLYNSGYVCQKGNKINC